jgi:dihydroflavonol-4-reductase
MKIFLTGATGFLGHHLLRLLPAQGHTVHALVRPTSDLSGLPSTGKIVVFKGDVTDPGSIIAASRGCEIAIHAAGIVSFDRGDAALMTAINVTGTENVCLACRQNGLKRLVHVSSVNALGFPEGTAAGDENTRFNWERFHLDYMDTKHRAEQVVLGHVVRGLDVVIVNPGTMFGPGDVNGHSGEYLRSAARGRLIGYITGGFTQCITERVAEGCLLAAEKGRTGERYVLGGFNLGYREFFDLIAEILGVRRPFLRIPAGLFSAAGWSACAFCRLFGVRSPVTPGLIRAAPLGLFYSSDKAVRELGYRPGNAEDLRNAILQHHLWNRGHGLS